MEFEIDGEGIRRSPGVFATFDTFRDLRSWACRAFDLGPPETARVAYFLHGQWTNYLPVLAVDFVLAPFYAISQPGQAPIVLRLV